MHTLIIIVPYMPHSQCVLGRMRWVYKDSMVVGGVLLPWALRGTRNTTAYLFMFFMNNLDGGEI